MRYTLEEYVKINEIPIKATLTEDELYYAYRDICAIVGGIVPDKYIVKLELDKPSKKSLSVISSVDAKKVMEKMGVFQTLFDAMQYQARKKEKPDDGYKYSHNFTETLQLKHLKGYDINVAAKRTKVDDFNKRKEREQSETKGKLPSDFIVKYVGEYSIRCIMQKGKLACVHNDLYNFRNQIGVGSDETKKFDLLMSITPRPFKGVYVADIEKKYSIKFTDFPDTNFRNKIQETDECYADLSEIVHQSKKQKNISSSVNPMEILEASVAVPIKKCKYCKNCGHRVDVTFIYCVACADKIDA